MVVQALVGREAEVGDEVFAQVGEAVAVGVLEARHERVVDDVEPAVVPRAAGGGVEFFGEDGAPPIGSHAGEADDGAFGLRGVEAGIARIIADVKRAGRIAANRGAGFDFWEGDELFEAKRGVVELGKFGRGWSLRGALNRRGAEEKERTEEGWEAHGRRLGGRGGRVNHPGGRSRREIFGSRR